jgi:tetratricopeptide (TPR) repeat protein
MKIALAGVLVIASVAYADDPPPPSKGKPQGTVLQAADVCPTKNTDADKAYNAANDAADAHHTADAEKLYLQALALDPKMCDAMDNLGVLYRHENRVDEAIVLFQKSIAIAPSDKAAFMDLAVALRTQKTHDDALSAYQSLVKLDASDPEGWFGVGSVYVQQKKYPDAIAPLEQARKLYKQSAPELVDDATTLLGMAYAENKNWPRTIECLESVYEHYGADGWVNLYLGRAYVQENDTAKAKTFFARASEDGVEPTSDEWKSVGGKPRPSDK